MFNGKMWATYGANGQRNMPNIQKMYFKDISTLVVKTDTDVHAYDFTHVKGGVDFKRVDGIVTPGNLMHHILWNPPNFDDIDILLDLLNKDNYGDRKITFDENTQYPIYISGSGEETNIDRTILFPPPETHAEWLERIAARLLHLTRRIEVLRHETPHQNALSENICRDVPEGHDEIDRYDFSSNPIKRPVGWIRLQIENYQAKYDNHLKKVAKAEVDGTAPPADFDTSGRQSIETMLEKLESELTEECLRDHFDLHDIAVWKQVQKKERKITLCNDDKTKSPGELLVDVNAFFTDGDGNRNEAAEAHAKRTYHEISTKYWVMSQRTHHRNIVMERIIA